MSDVERVFDRFIDAFAEDLLAIARAHIETEVARALAVAEKTGEKLSKAQLRQQKRAERLAAKERKKAERREARERKKAERIAAKEHKQAERVAERTQRQVEHDRLKQERLALKQELEAERRRLREASRKRPLRQLPLDFDGLRTPVSRRRDQPAPGSPPTLFVHKRKRDGQIEKLARKDESPAKPATATNGNGNGNGGTSASNGNAIVSNGVTVSPPAE